MNLSDTSIKRPIFTAMIMMAIVVFGGVMFSRLSVDLFPKVDFPIVTVTVIYPGADPETMETKVADKIEEAVNSLSGMIWPNVATAFGVFLLKGFFDSIPNALREAARIDGAGETRTFLQVMLPIIKPGIGALFILNFVQVWNDYLWQMVIGQEKTMKTLMVGTATLMQDLNPNFAYKMAGATVAAIPMLIIFLLFQRYFTQGMTAGAVKE